jgi:hypothetical protein
MDQFLAQVQAIIEGVLAFLQKIAGLLSALAPIVPVVLQTISAPRGA